MIHISLDIQTIIFVNFLDTLYLLINHCKTKNPFFLYLLNFIIRDIKI